MPREPALVGWLSLRKWTCLLPVVRTILEEWREIHVRVSTLKPKKNISSTVHVRGAFNRFRPPPQNRSSTTWARFKIGRPLHVAFVAIAGRDVWTIADTNHRCAAAIRHPHHLPSLSPPLPRAAPRHRPCLPCRAHSSCSPPPTRSPTPGEGQKKVKFYSPDRGRSKRVGTSVYVICAHFVVFLLLPNSNAPARVSPQNYRLLSPFNTSGALR